MPENLTEFWPSLVEVNNIQELPNGGHCFDWVYKMGGVRLTGSNEDVEFIPNIRTVSVSTGGIESTVTWEYEPDGDETIFTATTEYKVPVPVLGKLAESIVVRMNENEQEAILENVKARLEA